MFERIWFTYLRSHQSFPLNTTGEKVSRMKNLQILYYVFSSEIRSITVIYTFKMLKLHSENIENPLTKVAIYQHYYKVHDVLLSVSTTPSKFLYVVKR